jgi:hypothetical protein
MSRLPIRLLRAAVAVLALALSALGPARPGLERPAPFWDGEDLLAAVASADPDVARAPAASPVPAGAFTLGRGFAGAEIARPCPVGADIACPGPRLGSALGARAPDRARL